MNCICHCLFFLANKFFNWRFACLKCSNTFRSQLNIVIIRPALNSWNLFFLMRDVLVCYYLILLDRCIFKNFKYFLLQIFRYPGKYLRYYRMVEVGSFDFGTTLNSQGRHKERIRTLCFFIITFPLLKRFAFGSRVLEYKLIN